MNTYRLSNAAQLSLLALLFSVVSCGPQMQTNYQYFPPENPQGQACIFQCENSRMQCQHIQDMEYQRCQDRAEDRYQRCEDSNEYRRKDDKQYCYREYCSSPDGERCDNSYRSCYQSCGGRVTSETVCVANCDKQ